jgi:hypothetical protein
MSRPPGKLLYLRRRRRWGSHQPPARSPGVAGAFRDLFPDTYEELVKRIRHEHPEWSEREIDRWIAEQVRR